MVAGIIIGIIAVAVTAYVIGGNVGYMRGQQDTNARWTAYLSDKEEEIIRLQKERRAAMRILREGKEGRNDRTEQNI